MAWTVSTLKKTVFGDERVHHLYLVADAATEDVKTGLATIDAVVMAPKSLTAGEVSLTINETALGTSAAGTLAATGFTSGDELYVTVFGR